MTTSRHYREDLGAYIDLELDGAARAALEAHLATCDGCARELQLLRGLGEALAALPQAEPGPQFAARFHARLAREGGRRDLRARLRAWWSPLRLSLALGGAAAAVAAAILLNPTQAEPDPDWLIVADAESYELLKEEDLDLLAVLEILEAWDDTEER